MLYRHLQNQQRREGRGEDEESDDLSNLAPFHILHRTKSALPLHFLPPMSSAGSRQSAGRQLPKIVNTGLLMNVAHCETCNDCGGFVRPDGPAPASPSRCSDCGLARPGRSRSGRSGLGTCDDCGGLVRSGTARTRSLRSASASQLLGQARGASQRSSLRSSLTGLTEASMRREVHDAVQQEVAKVVQPLKEKLQSEQSARQRLEELLREAKGLGPTEALPL